MTGTRQAVPVEMSKGGPGLVLRQVIGLNVVELEATMHRNAAPGIADDAHNTLGIPYPGRAATLAIAQVHKGPQRGLLAHPDDIALRILGERMPERRELYAVFEAIMNELAIVEANARGSSAEVPTDLVQQLDGLSYRLAELEKTVARLKPSALAAEPG